MKKIFIVANWKSNKTELEAKAWIKEISNFQFPISNKEIIICPPFTLLSQIKSGIKNYELGFKIGAQNISPLGEGAYTGEINASQIKEIAQYCIIGHSERRKNFFENDETINSKINQAFEFGIMPIICISDLEQAKAIQTSVNKNSKFIVAYEPLFAIGSGNADTPENADQMAKNIKAILKEAIVLYGGSVTGENINTFTTMTNIDGVLVGKSSLDVKEFYSIIQNA